MADPHLVSILRSRLMSEFADDLPPGVRPVERWCREPQFFPGASGLLTDTSWDEVEPGSLGFPDGFPAVPNRGVMVIGNYQATVRSYQRIIDADIGGLATTWRLLRRVMAAVPPTQVFLTNANIGLPDLAKDTLPFPTTPEYRERCGRLLATEVELLDPRLVVCLGVKAAEMLARIATGLSLWRPWPGFQRLAATGDQVQTGCVVEACRFTAVAIQHPSAVVSSAGRDADAAIVAAAATLA